MDRSTDTSMATRTRSQKAAAQRSTSDDTPSTEFQETNDDFSKLNINKEEEYSQQQGNNMEENEQCNNPSDSNLQLHHLQESFVAELAQKQKIIEEQQQLLLQLQLNIQELMDEKHSQRHQELLTQATISNDNNSNLVFSSQMEPPHIHVDNHKSKYDNFMEQQLLKDKINNIRKFSSNK